MTRPEVHQKLTSIFREVLDDPSLEISDATTASDVEGWDSLAHINLIVAAEKAFGVVFTTKEVKGFKNVGDFIGAIAGRAK